MGGFFGPTSYLRGFNDFYRFTPAPQDFSRQQNGNHPDLATKNPGALAKISRLLCA